MKIEKIIKIVEGIVTLEDNKKIDSVIAYRLARLNDQCQSIIKSYQKQEMKLREEYSAKIKEITENLSSKSESEKKEIENEVRILNDEFITKINELGQIEEDVTVPELKLKDFEGKEVPYKFFAGLSEFIKE